MTDQQYYDCYAKLVSTLASEHELDGDLFFAIFEGKIKPIVRNTFAECAGQFQSIDLEDVCQDVFIKLWTNCVSAYFMNDKYETSAAWFLGWCKIVAKNYVTSLLRKKSLRGTETLDDPDRPVVIAKPDDAALEITQKESVADVFRAVCDLPSKIEMKLVWFGVYMLVYTGAAEDRIEANRVFLEKFAGLTVGELYGKVGAFLADADVILGEDVGDSMPVLADGSAERTVSEILGDDPLGKISDWIYKINKKLKDSLPPEVVKWNT